MNAEKKFYLRPHHGLCIQHYVGEGYSKEFIHNMDRTIEGLERNPNQTITLRSKIDVLCDYCPSNKEKICETADKVNKIDQNVLSICGFNEGQQLEWQQFKNKVKEYIIDQSKLEIVCNGCEWLQFCLKTKHDDTIQIIE